MTFVRGAGDAATITRRWFFGGKYPPTRACIGDTLAFAYEQGPHNVYVLNNGALFDNLHELSSFGVQPTMLPSYDALHALDRHIAPCNLFPMVLPA